MSARVVRVQNKDGRGPWMPGFSHKWVNPSRTAFFPAIFTEVGERAFNRILTKARERGLAVGCAVSESRLPEWFDAHERARLLGLGFNLVDASACEQLAITQVQRLIGKPNGLADLPVIDWPAP